MPATRTVLARTLAVCVLAAMAGGLNTPSARAEDSGQGGDQNYSYKRPSPTTITDFQSLYSMCTDSSSSQMAGSEHSLCVGYFNGIVDFYLSVTPVAERQFCLPSNPPLTRAQGRDKLVDWSQNNPVASRQPAAVGVYQFLVATFPCHAHGG